MQQLLPKEKVKDSKPTPVEMMKIEPKKHQSENKNVHNDTVENLHILWWMPWPCYFCRWRATVHLFFHIKFSLTEILFCAAHTTLKCVYMNVAPRINIQDYYLPRYDFDTCVIIFAFFIRCFFFFISLVYNFMVCVYFYFLSGKT